MTSDTDSTATASPISLPATPAATPALTVVVATYRGRDRIARTMESLERQTADPASFEVLVVVNGPDDGTSDLIREFARQAPVNVRLLTTPVPGFANARNVGIRGARGTYVTWVDDDDWVSPSFIASMLRSASPRCVVLPVFGDVDPGAGSAVNFENYINNSVLRYSGQTVRFADLPTAASFDAGKVVATEIARTVVYDEHLASGLDVLYWAGLILRNRLSITVPPLDSHAVYYRTVRSGSISRCSDDRFVQDRLSCIEKLEKLKPGSPAGIEVVRALQGGQAGNLGEWLRQTPERRPDVLQRVRDLDISDFPYRVLNRRSAERLVVAYAFPPVLDTSGLVAAKRLLLAGEPYDVVTHSMRGAREVDPMTALLIKEHLGDRVRFDGKPVTANMRGIAQFCEHGFEGIAPRERTLGSYRDLYSRAMWPAAHVMGAAYKTRHPETTWTAEFSDPLLINVMGAKRVGGLPDIPLVRDIQDAVAGAGFNLPSDNFYQWLETATFALADRIVFTNDRQRELMMQHAAHPDLVHRVMEISEVSHHPVLPRSYYSLAASGYDLDPGRVNLGYFGVFYGSRDVKDLLDALVQLTMGERTRLLLHIFTNKPQESLEVVAALGLDDCVRVNAYYPFLEFLDLTTRLDWLVVADAKVTASHGVNPYLPSKYADYAGSGTNIWSLVEPGSTLSQLPAARISELGDLDAAVEFLRSLA